MSDFQDKVVLVTGAGRGLGRALARAFASHGAALALNDLTPVHLDSLEAEIRDLDGQAKSYLADVSKKLSLQTMVSEVLSDWGRIDVLINHARVAPLGPLLEMDEWDWRRTLEVNVSGVFLATQVVGRVMRELGGGVILNVGLDEQRETGPQAAYFASKIALVGFTQAAAAELAADKIRVHLLMPRASKEESVQEALRLCAAPKGKGLPDE